MRMWIEKKPDRVLLTHFKIAEKDISQADILRTATNLLNDLEKNYVVDNADYHEMIEAYNEEYHIYNDQFFAKIRNKALQLVERNHLALETLIALIHKHIKAYHRFCSAIKRLKHLRLMLQEDVFMVVPAPKNSMKTQRYLNHIELYSLTMSRRLLLKSISEREFIILFSRKYQINKVINLLASQSENTMVFFRGMTIENQKIFIKQYFKIKEREVIKKAQLQISIHNNRAKYSDPIKRDIAIMTSFVLDKMKVDLEKSREKNKQIDEQTLQKIKQLGSTTGNYQINNNRSDKHCLEKCRDLENHSIMQPLQKHLMVVNEYAEILEKEKQELAMIEQSFNVRAAHNKDKTVDELEYLLDSIEFDPNIDLTQLSDISLLDSNTKSRPNL